MTLASRPRAPCSRGAKPKNFLSFLFAAPPTPPRSEKFERKEIFGFAAAASLLQKGYKCSLAFLPVLRPPFLRRLRRPEALPSPRSVVI